MEILFWLHGSAQSAKLAKDGGLIISRAELCNKHNLDIYGGAQCNKGQDYLFILNGLCM